MPEMGFNGFPGKHLVIPQGYAQAVLYDAPRAYYRLGETSGTTMGDTANNLGAGTYTTGTILNQTSLLARDANPAASFNGSSGATIPSCVFTGDFTWECWAQWAVSHLNENDAFFGHSSSFIVALFGGKLAYYNGSWVTVGGTAPAAGAPYHVAYVRSGTTVTAYLNGVADGTGTLSGSVTFDRVGTAFGDNRTFDGVLDEVAFYTTALSAARIAAHYKAGK